MLRKTGFPYVWLGVLLFALIGQFAIAQRNDSGRRNRYDRDHNEIGRHAPILVNQAIDEDKQVTLKGNTHPEATPEHDDGNVSDDYVIDHMLLQLKRSPEQEQALQQYLEELHTEGSPNFQRWLTAQEFGQRFGVSNIDIASLTRWLEKHRLKINVVYPSGMVIDFSGTARQVEETFHTDIHKLNVKGKSHVGNINDPKIPATFAPIVAGIVSLHNFSPHAMHQMRKAGSFTFGDFLGGTNYVVAPADLATIYNLNPLFNAGYSGQGQTVAVIEDTDVFSGADWKTFRSTLGLSKYTSGSFKTVYPAPPNGPNNCSKPGVIAPNDAEAILDAEWASAAAPSASIVMATCADSTVTFGGLIALQNLINASNRPPAVMSISYGQCEAANGAAANAAYNSAYQQSVSEGVSVFVAAGDSGAAGCDNSVAQATHGIGVNAFASTPYNVAVGGTDFSDTYAGTNSTYWNSANTSAFGSARSYIPEIPWNDSCAGALFANYEGFNITYGPNSLCNDPTLGPFVLSTVAGGGGPSACATGAPSTAGVVGGTCKGWPKPSWQSIYGNPSDGVRDTPDVSLFAADGLWGHYYVFCWSDTVNGGAACSGDPSTWSGAGGTSFSSPVMAGIQALVNQRAGARQGNPNPVYYRLAANEYSSSSGNACNSSNGAGVPNTCIFYDVTQGDMDVNCTGNANCFLDSSPTGVLSTSNTSFKPAYGATTGWDFATGIGSLNAANLVNNWPGTKPTFTLSTSSSNVSVKQGSSATTAVIVTAWNGFTGNVTFSASGLPTGVTASFSPTSTQTTSTLTLTAGNSAALGTATVTITGVSGGLTSATTINLSVVSPGSFTLSALQTSLSIVQGTSGNVTVTITPQNGFSGSVDLSASGLPSGVTASFNPSSTSTSSILTLAASSTAAPGTLNVTITGASGNVTSTTTIALTVSAAPSFTLAASPSTLNVIQGNSGSTTITATPQNGFSGTVNFSASGLPNGVTASFAAINSTASTLTLSASSTAATGTVNVTVTGTSGTVNSTATIALTVSAAPSFTLAASPSTLNVIQGNSGSTTITATPQNGFSGTVNYSASGLPNGVTASFAAINATSSTATLSANSSATTGKVNVTVTGTSGTLTSTTTIALTVAAPPSYSISASPASLNVIQGTSGSTIITVTPQNGFNASVSLSISALPTGVTASFNPSSTTNTSTLTFTTDNTAAFTTTAITINSSSGTLTSSTSVLLTVSPVPTFALSASPSNVSITQGANSSSTISVAPLNGFSSSVNFSVSALPAGVTAAFNPASATTTVLTFTASSSASTGTSTVTVTGVSGAIAQTAAITLTVNPSAPVLPSVWSDGDVGSVFSPGRATYTNGVFTLKGSGQWIWDIADGFHFAYQPLSGDATIVARVLTATGTQYPEAGVMIREALTANSTHAFTTYEPYPGPSVYFYARAVTGSTTSSATVANTALPYWVKLVRSGSTFTSYASPDGITWTQVGTSQSISMAQNVYIGLAVSANNSTGYATATFDNVSITTPSAPAPAVASASPVSGPVGTQVVINGSGFGASQGNSVVELNDTVATASAWNNTSITVTVPAGASSGPLVVCVAPNMNCSNPVTFTVTSPLPNGWLDQDVGSVSTAGTASYRSGTYILTASGQWIWDVADGMHFAYQSLSGDGTIIARVVSAQGSQYPEAGVMIRETLTASSTHAFVAYEPYPGPSLYLYSRATTGSTTSSASTTIAGLPYWVKLVRRANTFTGYISADGVSWVQMGTSQTITMAQTVYIGLAVSANNNSAVATATFDNVSVTMP